MKKHYMGKKKLFEGRSGEVIGGGFFVYRRGKKTNRVAISTSLPFEHPSYESALKEAHRLATLCPGETFCVFQQLIGVVDK